MKNRVFFFLIAMLCSSLSAAAQIEKPDLTKYKTYDAKIEAWKAYCRTVLARVYSGSNDMTMQTFINVNREGLQLIKKDDFKNETYFIYYIGAGFQAFGKQDSAVAALETAVRNYGKLKLLKEEVTAIRMLHYAYFYSGRFAKRDTMIWRLEKMLPITKDPLIKSIMLSTLSEYSYDHASYEKAINYKLTAISSWKAIYAKTKTPEDKSEIGIAYVQIAETYLLLQQYDKALVYQQLGVPYLSNNRNSMVTVNNNYINIYLGQNNIKGALKSFNDLKRLATKDDPLYAGLNQASISLAGYYLDHMELNTALTYANRALNYALITNQPQNIVGAHAIMGKVLYEKKDYNGAVMHLKKAQENSYNFGREGYAGTNQKLAESYAGIKDYENAFRHYKIYAKLQDTLYKEASKRSIAEMDAKYQASASKQEIKLLNVENTNKNIALKAASRTRWFMGIAILLSLLTAISIYRSYKNKQKANLLLDKKNQQLDSINIQLSEANQTKAKLFSIISHDLRSPVSQLFSFLNLQQTKPDEFNEVATKHHQQQLKTAASALLETMEDLLLWSKSQMDNFETDIEPLDIDTLFKDVIALMSVQAINKQMKIIHDTVDCGYILSDFNLVRTILRNLVQNAINHSIVEATIVLKCGKNASGKSFLAVINDTKEITREKMEQLMQPAQVKSSSSGYGLIIIKELAQKINAEIALSINKDDKFEVQLIFKD